MIRCDVTLRTLYMFLFIFFFKQKTAYELRISDWSSDVCSSDLVNRDVEEVGQNADVVARAVGEHVQKPDSRERKRGPHRRRGVHGSSSRNISSTSPDRKSVV